MARSTFRRRGTKATQATIAQYGATDLWNRTWKLYLNAQQAKWAAHG